MISTVSLVKSLRAKYENETPAERSVRMQENKERLQALVASWRTFEAQYPDLARHMVA